MVLPGPLKSNGSPARMIAVMLFGLVVLGFVMVRRTAHAPRVSPGAIILLIYLLLWLTTYGAGLLQFDPSPGRSVIEASMTRSIINLIANVGIGLYVLARVRTARQRNIVLGCLAAGLTFACLVGLLQTVTSIDLRFLFQPPGFVLNTDDLSLVDRVGVNRAIGNVPTPNRILRAGRSDDTSDDVFCPSTPRRGTFVSWPLPRAAWRSWRCRPQSRGQASSR